MFALCGAISRYIWDPDTWRAWLAFPIPFGLLSGWIIARKRLLIYVLLSIAVWNAAYRTTMELSGDADFLAFSLGGLIGGAGLGFGASVSHSFLLPRNILITAALGLVSAWAFFLPESWNLSFVVSFAIWQGTVGTALCRLKWSR